MSALIICFKFACVKKIHEKISRKVEIEKNKEHIIYIRTIMHNNILRKNQMWNNKPLRKFYISLKIILHILSGILHIL